MIKYEYFIPKKSEKFFLQRQLKKWQRMNEVKYKLIVEKDESNSLFYSYFRVWSEKNMDYVFESAKNIQELILKTLRQYEKRGGISPPPFSFF